MIQKNSLTHFLKNSLVFAVSACVLAGCSSIEERQKNAINTLEVIQDTASGAVKDVTEDVQNLQKVTQEAQKGINSLVDGIEKRMVEVQSGAQLIQKGVNTLKGE